MQLKKIKVSGFKSFVDPTIVPFPSQRVAVVGPNGCGKSNIIDAVRWVMGEGSAKNLRGESMTDVIFKGSSQRKPVGQASVELIFDNSLGRFSGQYASYQEISVKRILTRDGDSAYLLNGGRCRRRDITDIFLGTGAGVRGYSIIGQNTISKLIEARPEELRAFLEEAAGVSKYKERRRETIQRMQQTREHLDRVEDIRGELGKQLERLESQAKTAIRYKSLKSEERQCKIEILACKWRDLTMELEQARLLSSRVSESFELKQSQHASFTKENATQQGKLNQFQFITQQKQDQFYKLGTEIARFEELSQQSLRDKRRQYEEKQQLEIDLENIRKQINEDSQSLILCRRDLSLCLDDLGNKQKQLADMRVKFDSQEIKEKNWQEDWQDLQDALHKYLQEKHVGQINIDHIEKRHQQTMVRLEKIYDESSSFDLVSLQEEQDRIKQKYASIESEIKLTQGQIKTLEEKELPWRQALNEYEMIIRKSQDDIIKLTTESTALKSSIRNISSDANSLIKWQDAPRLVEELTVDKIWQPACEFVFGDLLRAITIDSITSIAPDLQSISGTNTAFASVCDTTWPPAKYPRLIDKVNGPLPKGWCDFENIFAAETFLEGLSWLPYLSTNQSVISIDGFWLSQNWVRVADFARHDESSFLARQQRLDDLEGQLILENKNLCDTLAKREDLHSKILNNDSEQRELKKQHSFIVDLLHETDAVLKKNIQALQFATQRCNNLQEEQWTLQQDLEEYSKQRTKIERDIKNAVTQLRENETLQAKLSTEKEIWLEAHKICKQHVEALQSSLHETQIQINKFTSNASLLEGNIAREKTRDQQLAQKLQILSTKITEHAEPDKDLNSKLASALESHRVLQQEILEIKQQAQVIQDKMLEDNALFANVEREVKHLQERIIQEQLKIQALEVRLDNAVDSSKEYNIDLEVVLGQLNFQTSIADRENTLQSLQSKIQRLGAINLVAIEEYEIENGRKNHLDSQSRDLNEALLTLDKAILKLDRETQSRLKETFELVNDSFKSLFPRLFGGGNARLELTSENLLDAGIMVMAQPPGKRNSTIHLLSGGEKAMTAIALVFAFFELNPSPFCLLDEVDAPLDDLNVGRFCDLVREMSKVVQFIIITHNKVTMELAEHLIGVTMHEPGVSRVVSVDVEQAIEMAN